VGAPAGASEGAPVGAPAVGAPVGAPARALVGGLAGAPCTGGRALWWKQPWWEPRWGPCPPPRWERLRSIRTCRELRTWRRIWDPKPQREKCAFGGPQEANCRFRWKRGCIEQKQKQKHRRHRQRVSCLRTLRKSGVKGGGGIWDLGCAPVPRATRSIADGCRTPACSRREGPPTSRRMPIYVRKKTGRGAYWYWLVLNEPIIRGLACVIAYLVLSTGPGALKQPAQAIASGAQALTLP
jgi:hypothetical protein